LVGSLIGPDVVLTAAHCGNQGDVYVEIGREDKSETSSSYETIQVKKEIPHPWYVADVSVRYDQLIMILSSISTYTPIQVNFDPDLPILDQDATIMGWGLTKSGENDSASPILLDAQVQIMTNSDCEQSSLPFFPWTSYQGQITEDMVCAYASGKDACQGDSGGPLIVGASDGSDLQVGVVSWGFGCAQENFPGVYSRTSFDPDWMTSIVCQHSVSPPEYFQCKNETLNDDKLDNVFNATVAPSHAPLVDDGLLTGTIQIQMDRFPKDIGWQLDLISDSIVRVAQRIPGVYKTPFALEEESVMLLPDQLYSFVIYDINKDGLCCTYGEGGYQILVGNSVVFNNYGQFQIGMDATFYASETKVTEMIPKNSSSSDLELVLEIRFDEYPEDVGWILTNHNDAAKTDEEIVAFKLTGSYDNSSSGLFVQESIFLPSAGSYTFHFLDLYGDGICCDYGIGYYRIYKGRVEYGKLLVEGTGIGLSRETTSFLVGEGNVDDETHVNNVTSIQMAAFVTIIPGSNSEDIGWTLRDSHGKELLSQPIGHYKSTNRIRETIELEAETSFYEFEIVDQSGNGMASSKVFGLETLNGLVGYGLGLQPSQTTFFVPPGDFLITLKVQTDSNPEEIFWRLERLDLDELATVALLPASFYADSLTTISHEFLISKGGFYRFTIQDVNSDGICCTNGEGSVEITMGLEDKVVAKHEGNYTDSMAIHFLAEVSEDQSSYSNPRILTLVLKFDEHPEDISWILRQEEEVTASTRAMSSSQWKMVGFGPQLSYSTFLAKKSMMESIPIEDIPKGSTRNFQLVVFDVSGDGLCCKSGNGEYALYDGNPNAWNSSLLLSGNGKDRSRVVHSFSLSHDGSISTSQDGKSHGTRPGCGFWTTWWLGIIS
jgi:Trypsin